MKRIASHIVALGCAAAGISGHVGAAAPSGEMPSHYPRALSGEVEKKLERSPAGAFADIDVAMADNGVVILTGVVPTALAKTEATEAAESVRGVRSVDNRLAVQPRVARRGGELEAAVTQALVENPSTESFDVRVQAGPAGAVMLTGAVQSWVERALAARVAEGVMGVVNVQNNLDVRTPPTRADAQIAADVREVLKWDAYTDAARLDVRVRDAVVTLTGTAQSAAAKRRIASLAWVNGVRRVDASRLQIEPVAAADSETEGDARSEQVRRAVERAVQRGAYAPLPET